jgi:hypothetical protein
LGLLGLLVGGLLVTALFRLEMTSAARDSGFGAPILQVLRENAHHFRELRQQQDLWNPQDPEHLKQVVTLGTRYIAALEAIDLNACPPAFAHPFCEHMRTWSRVVAQLQALQNAPRPTYEERPAYATRVTAATKPLENSWAKVHAAAQKFGVAMP